MLFILIVVRRMTAINPTPGREDAHGTIMYLGEAQELLDMECINMRAAMLPINFIVHINSKDDHSILIRLA